MVNVYFVRDRISGGWVLVNTGMPGFAGIIRPTADRLFGEPPRGILLTHGHVEHAGSVATVPTRGACPCVSRMPRGGSPNRRSAVGRMMPANPGMPVSTSTHPPEIRSRTKYTFTISVRRRYNPEAIC